MARCDMSMLILNDIIEKTWGGVMAANGFTRPATVRGCFTLLAHAGGKPKSFHVPWGLCCVPC